MSETGPGHFDLPTLGALLRGRAGASLRGFALCLGVTAVLLGVLLLAQGHGENAASGTAGASSAGAASGAASGAAAGADSTAGQESTPAADDPYLILVNNNLPLAQDYAPQTAVADAATGKELETQAAAAYQSMAAAAQAEDVSLILCSGYRDYAYQQDLFAKRTQKYEAQGYDAEQAAALAKTVVAMPGCSEHQTGLAADIVTESHQNLDSGFAATDAYRWLSEHAAEYGFILRYPEDRQAATGIIYEPWHWRYVGVENARAIRESGLSLEEFLALHTAADSTAG